MINVKNISNNTYKVTLNQGGSHSYTVTVKPEYYQKLTGGSVSPEQLIEKSFEFLLERESPSMIRYVQGAGAPLRNFLNTSAGV